MGCCASDDRKNRVQQYSSQGPPQKSSSKTPNKPVSPAPKTGQQKT